MPITFGQARSILAPFAGVSGLAPDSDDVELFVTKVLQYMLNSGTNGNERVFNFYAVNGWITLPYELQTPLKVKVGGVVGNVWDKWFDWRHGALEADCSNAQDALYEDPNTYPTIYEVPAGNWRIATLATEDECEDAHLIITGKDATGRQIYLKHKGEETGGEYLSIKKGRLMVSQVAFATIESVTKTKTNGYVHLYAIDERGVTKKLLADYSPFETVPQYRRFRLTTVPSGGIVRVSILGRIQLKQKYADTDPIPFDNLFALDVAGQAVRANRNDDMQTVAAKDAIMTNLIEKENSHKRINNGQPIVDVYRPLSNGSIPRLF